MSVADIASWRLPGCGHGCWPRSHDPLEHEQYGREMERETQRRSVVRTGPLVIDLTAQTVTVNGAAVVLSGREYGILAALAERPGLWRSTEDLLATVWGPEYVTRRPFPGSRCGRADLHGISVVLSRLRQRLGAAAHLIETAKGLRGLRRLRMVEPT